MFSSPNDSDTCPFSVATIALRTRHTDQRSLTLALLVLSRHFRKAAEKGHCCRGQNACDPRRQDRSAAYRFVRRGSCAERNASGSFRSGKTAWSRRGDRQGNLNIGSAGECGPPASGRTSGSPAVPCGAPGAHRRSGRRSGGLSGEMWFQAVRDNGASARPALSCACRASANAANGSASRVMPCWARKRASLRVGSAASTA